jgi:hypothetical protein
MNSKPVGCQNWEARVDKFEIAVGRQSSVLGDQLAEREALDNQLT